MKIRKIVSGTEESDRTQKTWTKRIHRTDDERHFRTGRGKKRLTMANFRPAGMSSDEDEDEYADYECGSISSQTKSKTDTLVTPAPAVQNENRGASSMPTSRGRGRGRGALRLPWGEVKDDSCGSSSTAPSPRQFQGPSPSSSSSVGLHISGLGGPCRDGQGPNLEISGSHKPLGSQDDRGRGSGPSVDSWNDMPPTFGKKPYLDSIPYLDTTNAEEIYRELKRGWTNYEFETFCNWCSGAYKQSENPYSLGLFLMVRSSDFFTFQTSRTFSVVVITQLKSYLEQHKIEGPLLDLKLQETAFSLVMMQKKCPLMKLVIDVFQIDKIRDRMVESVKNFSNHGQFKEACSAATALGLYCFDVHMFLIPLVLQDRLAMVEEYIESSSEMQRSLLSFLDQLIPERYNLTNVLLSYIDNHNVNLKEVKVDKLNEKSITKLIKRLAEKYKVDPVNIPNVKYKQKFGEVRHLFFRRYEEKTNLNEDNFHEFLGELVGSSKQLIEEALYLMRTHNDYPSAVKFVRRFNIPDELIPSDIFNLVHGHEKPNQITTVQDDESWETDSAEPAKAVSTQSLNLSGHRMASNLNLEAQSQPQDDEECYYIQTGPPVSGSDTKATYEIPLSFDSIFIISTPFGVLEFCNYIQNSIDKDGSVVAGFDAEWKPVMATLECAALLQIAFKERIFLIDIVTLKKCDAGEQKIAFENILEHFFANEKVLKLGYDLKNDMKMLCAVVQEWQKISSKMKTVLDLHFIKAEIFKINRGFFLSSSQPGTEAGGLSELIDLCLQTNLSKVEQFSDWERRPLNKSQVIYAAADAYCLLQIYEFMKLRETEVSIGIHEMIKKYQKSREEPARKRLSPLEVVGAIIPFKRTRELPNEEVQFNVPRMASDVKFICDNMLQGLGKQLRRCGINTEIIETGQHYYHSIGVARRDNKLFLTKGKLNFKDLANELPPGNAYYMQTDTSIEQLEEVFGHFNIIVNEDHSFTFCQQCNSNVFVKVSMKTVRELVPQGVRSQKRLVENALENFKQRVPEDMVTYIGDCQKNWTLRHESDLTIRNNARLGPQAFTSSGVTVDLNKIPVHLLDYINDVYVCQNCGRCYWDSKRLQDLLLVVNQTDGANIAASSN